MKVLITTLCAGFCWNHPACLKPEKKKMNILSPVLINDCRNDIASLLLHFLNQYSHMLLNCFPSCLPSFPLTNIYSSISSSMNWNPTILNGKAVFHEWEEWLLKSSRRWHIRRVTFQSLYFPVSWLGSIWSNHSLKDEYYLTWIPVLRTYFYKWDLNYFLSKLTIN